jgi:hypothetical protein
MEILTSRKRAVAKTAFLQQKRPFLNKKSLADVLGFMLLSLDSNQGPSD